MKCCETCDYFDEDSEMCALTQVQVEKEDHCGKYSGYDIYDDVDVEDYEEETPDDLDDEYSDLPNKTESIFEDF